MSASPNPIGVGPRPPGRKPVIGLAGGVGSGKSRVAAMLAEHGALVIDSDALNQQQLDSAEVIATLSGWWGPSVVRPDGRLDRRRVAEIVFAEPDQRRRLEAFLHPRIDAERKRIVAQSECRPEVAAFVLDAPLLYEAGLDAECDAVIFVDALPEVRQARVAQRGWSPEELARREKAQWPLDSKRQRAEYTCTNNSDEESLRHQVDAIFTSIRSQGAMK